MPETVDAAGRSAAAEGVPEGCAHPSQRWKCWLKSKRSKVPGKEHQLLVPPGAVQGNSLFTYPSPYCSAVGPPCSYLHKMF